MRVKSDTIRDRLIMALGVKQLIIVGDLVKEIFRVQAILNSRKFKKIGCLILKRLSG